MPTPAPIPDAIRDVARTLRAGHREAWLVGETLFESLCGDSPASYQIATDAAWSELLDRFPHAVVSRPAEDTLFVPTGAGPVDVTRFRDETQLESDLAVRPFSIEALALDPLTDELRDPHGGWDDLLARRLRAVGLPADRLGEAPICALRAARLVATRDFSLESSLEAALPKADLAAVPPQCIRPEVSRLLLASHPANGLALLRRAGLEATLVPDVLSDSADLVEELPAELATRLSAWLRGTRPERVLRQLGFTGSLARRVTQLVRHHPIDMIRSPHESVTLRRLMTRLGPRDREILLNMRRTEALRAPEPEAQQIDTRLAELVEAFARIEEDIEHAKLRDSLALDGREVMEALGCSPGRRVGRALNFLSGCVARDPSCNEPETLRRNLAAWAAENPE